MKTRAFWATEQFAFIYIPVKKIRKTNKALPHRYNCRVYVVCVAVVRVVIDIVVTVSLLLDAGTFNAILRHNANVRVCVWCGCAVHAQNFSITAW